MAKPLKIEQYKLHDVVAAGVRAGKNPQQIADECSRKANTSISNMAVIRYLDSLGTDTSKLVDKKEQKRQREKREVIIRNPDKVASIVNRDIDLIELQFRTTQTLADRFDYMVDLPQLFEERMQQLAGEVKDSGIDSKTLTEWAIGMAEDMRRNVQSVTILNRELRENSKFISSLREKAFEFSLIQEYLMLFLEGFKASEQEIHGSTSAFEAAEQKIASNPRMQRIVEQQKELRGYEEG